MRRLLMCAASSLILLMACGGDEGLAADSPYFDGLPPDVVEEALANPTLQRNLEGDTDSAKQSLAQAAVRNFIFCREELRVYEAWIETGSAPTVSPGPVPREPLEPGNSAVEQDYSRLEDAVASGEPTQLERALTANGSCGRPIPPSPGDPNGPTIAEVVQGTGP